LRKAHTSATLTPAQQRALFTLVVTEDGPLLERPVTALAEAMGVDTSVAQRHLAALAKAGFVKKQARYRVVVLAPAEVRCHSHPKGDPCPGFAGQVVYDLMATTVATVRADFRCDARRDARCRRYLLEGRMGNRSAKQVVKGWAEVYSSSSPPAGRERNRQAQMLLAFYTKRRRRLHVGYQPTRSDTTAAAKAVAGMKTRFITAGLYESYVDHCFVVFAGMMARQGKAVIPPPLNFLKSANVMDGFLAELGPREINVEAAAKVLAEAGMGTLDPGLVMTIARMTMETGDPLPPATPADLAGAVKLVVERFQDIGYREVG